MHNVHFQECGKFYTHTHTNTHTHTKKNEEKNVLISFLLYSHKARSSNVRLDRVLRHSFQNHFISLSLHLSCQMEPDKPRKLFSETAFSYVKKKKRKKAPKLIFAHSLYCRLHCVTQTRMNALTPNKYHFSRDYSPPSFIPLMH